MQKSRLAQGLWGTAVVASLAAAAYFVARQTPTHDATVPVDGSSAPAQSSERAVTRVQAKAAVSRDTPAWLRWVIAVEVIGSAAYLGYVAIVLPFTAVRTESNISLISEALLAFLVIIAIDGFGKDSITRDQQWLNAWIARPTVVALVVAILVNMQLPPSSAPLVPAVEQTTAGTFVIGGTYEPDIVLSVASAFVIWTLILSVTLVTLISFHRLREAARRAPGRPPV